MELASKLGINRPVCDPPVPGTISFCASPKPVHASHEALPIGATGFGIKIVEGGYVHSYVAKAGSEKLGGNDTWAHRWRSEIPLVIDEQLADGK